MLRVYLLPTHLVDRYRGRSPARMRPDDSPGPRRPFVGSGWTRTDWVERVLLAGSARARARDIARSQPLGGLGRTGTHRRGSPPWAPAADGSPVRLPHLLVRQDLPSSNRLLGPARPTSKKASFEPRPAVRVPAPVPGPRHQAAPHHRPPAAFTTSRARAPDERPPPRCRVRPRPIPTQARASAPGGFEHRPTSRARSGEARWRRSEDLLTNRLAAARARSWRRWRRGNPCPAAGPFRPWDILERRRDLGVARGT
jgi:hypothetical protein